MADAPEKFSRLVRFGYAGRGMVYLLLGWLALGTRASVNTGNQAVFDMLQDLPLGRIALIALVVGLAGYVTFKLLALVCDIEHHGSDARGLLHRLANVTSATGYSIVAYSALRFALGMKHSAGGSQAKAVVHSALDWSLGSVAVGLVGVGFVIGAGAQVRQAVTGHFMHRVSGRAPTWVEGLGRMGYAA